MSKDNGTTTAAESKSGNMLLWLANATTADLAEIDQEIAKVQGEIDAVLAKHKGRLASLQSLRKVIDLKVNGAKERKKPTRKAASKSDVAIAQPSIVEFRRKVAQILGTKGPMLANQIADYMDLPDGRAVGQRLNCDWFEPTSQGYRLTPIGRRESGI